MAYNKLTKQGELKLRQELEELKEARAVNLVQLEEARANGDLSENADYSAAKDNQKIIEGRIAEIKNILDSSIIIEVSNSSSTNVQFGSHVTVKDLSDDSVEEYFICSTVEANILENKISMECPLALAILGRKVGDVVTVNIDHPYSVEILKIA